MTTPTARDRLADHIALNLFGKDLNPDSTPIGWGALATVGRELALPIADAVLECPGIQVDEEVQA